MLADGTASQPRSTWSPRATGAAAAVLLVASSVCWICGHREGDGSAPHPRPAFSRRAPAAVGGGTSLEADCRRTAEWVRRQLGPGYVVIVRDPIVVAGDLPEAQLDHWHRTAIQPAQRAMGASYFIAPITEPITILLFASEQSYRECAARVFGDRDVSRYGYYRPHLRTILVNLGAGCEGLFHELTHALMGFDFPDAPEWLSEGLASLHERAQLCDDGKSLEGLANWRLDLLREAIRENRLPPVLTLVAGGEFRGPHERLNYAHARCFCQYLQNRGLLTGCYRACRAGVAADRRGAAAVAGLFPGLSWEEVNVDFRRWLAQSTEPSGSVAPLGITATPSQIMP